MAVDLGQGYFWQFLQDTLLGSLPADIHPCILGYWLFLKRARGPVRLLPTFSQFSGRGTLKHTGLHKFTRKWGEAGDGPSQFREAFGIAIEPESGVLYISDHK